jgi:hypothetical protein
MFLDLVQTLYELIPFFDIKKVEKKKGKERRKRERKGKKRKEKKSYALY